MIQIISIALLFLAAFNPAKATGPNPVCLLNQCGGFPLPVGLFDIYCEAACVAAFYDGGVCTNSGPPSPGYAQCVCAGTGSPSLLATPEACELFCADACLTCGYNPDNYQCTAGFAGPGTVNCKCNP